MSVEELEWHENPFKEHEPETNLGTGGENAANGEKVDDTRNKPTGKNPEINYDPKRTLDVLTLVENAEDIYRKENPPPTPEELDRLFDFGGTPLESSAQASQSEGSGGSAQAT